MSKITETEVSLYRSLFNVRKDVFARYWEDLQNNKSGYSPVYKLNHKPQSLTDQVIVSHLEGNQTIGVYPLFPDNTTSFLAIDFDGSNWLQLINQVKVVADTSNLPSHIERSRSGCGGHLWFFFENQLTATSARQMGKILLAQAGIKTRKTYDRMFPSQDQHIGKGYGNLICLPFQGKLVKEEKTIFVDQDGSSFPDQLKYLKTIKKITSEQIQTFLFKISKKTINATNIAKTALIAEDLKDNEEEEETLVPKTQGGQVNLIISAGIFIPNLWLPDKVYRFLKKELDFPNPEYYTKERFGYSTWQTPRRIKTLEAEPGGIRAPIGCLEELLCFCEKNNFNIDEDDQRTVTKPIVIKSKLTLRKDQQKVLNDLAKHDRTILNAQPGFGKTMVALSLMKKRRQKTLIVVHTNTLLQQWIKRIKDYTCLTEGDVGIVGNNKWHIGKKVTVASYMTLARRGVEEIKDQFGLIIVDECHHVPANSFSAVVKKFSSRYALGLTATTFRKDKLEKLMHLYISHKIVSVSNIRKEDRSTSSDHIETQLITRKTNLQTLGKIEDFQQACKLVISDEFRNNQIVDDIAQVLSSGAKCLVLTERLDHCEKLLSLVRQNTKGVHAAIATSILTRKQRERIAKRMHQDRFQLLIATGKLIGEGFDWPEVSHLFLAFPFSWKGKLIQYLGRVQRAYEGKTIAVVHDYFDVQIPMLKLMYFKRLRSYRTLGLVKITEPNKKKSENKDQLSLF